MTLQKVENLPYEILLRFNFGGEHQRPENKLGDFEGAHFIAGTAIVDTDAGSKVVNYTPGLAQHIELDQVTTLLGDRFAAFEQQVRSLQELTDGQAKQIADLTTKLATAEGDGRTAIAQRETALAELSRIHAGIAGVLTPAAK